MNSKLFYEAIRDLLQLLPGSEVHRAEQVAAVDLHQAEHNAAVALGQDIADTEKAPAPSPAETAPAPVTLSSTEGTPA